MCLSMLQAALGYLHKLHYVVEKWQCELVFVNLYAHILKMWGFVCLFVLIWSFEVSFACWLGEWEDLPTWTLETASVTWT